MSAMARWISTSLTIAATAGVTSSGCSSSSDGAASSCGKVSPCGGNIVGAWKIQTGCANSASAPIADMACSGETFQIDSLSASGSVTFNADMTYTVSVNESFSETVNTPTTCLSMGGATVACSDLSATASAAAMGLDAGMTKASCATAGSNCACTIAVSNAVDNETGTYTLSGSTFTTTPNGAMVSSMSSGTGYCVQGNTLHVISTMMAMGTSTGPTGDIVATKQ